jgi:hypothetical protein
MRIPFLPVCLVMLVTLGGCQHLELLEDTTVLSEESFSRLWTIYSHCRSSLEPDEMREDMQHLTRALHRMSEAKNKPSFLPQSVQHLIEASPLRLAVDPGAMAMACALRAGQAAQAEGRTEMAAEIFRVVLSKDREPTYMYYVAQAKLGLAEMQSMIGQVIEGPAQIMKVSVH